MSKRKNIEKELEKFVSVYESGGGFGDPEAKAEHERKFQLLMHKQLTVVNNRNSNRKPTNGIGPTSIREIRRRTRKSLHVHRSC